MLIAAPENPFKNFGSEVSTKKPDQVIKKPSFSFETASFPPVPESARIFTAKKNELLDNFEKPKIIYDMKPESEKKLLQTLKYEKHKKSAVVLIYKSDKHSIYALASLENKEDFTDSLEKVTILKVNEVTSYDLSNLKPLTAKNINAVSDRLELFENGDELAIQMKKKTHEYLPEGEYLFFSYRITLFSLTKWEVTKAFAPECFLSMKEYKFKLNNGEVRSLEFLNELQQNRLFLKSKFEKQGLVFVNGPEPYFVLTDITKPIYGKLYKEKPELIAKECILDYEGGNKQSTDLRKYSTKVLKLNYEKVLEVIHAVHFKSVSLFLMGGDTSSEKVPFAIEHLALLAKYCPKFTLVEPITDITSAKSEVDVDEKDKATSEELKAAQMELQQQKEMYEKLSKTFAEYKTTTEAEFENIQELIKKMDLDK